jgi:hypothetical protein
VKYTPLGRRGGSPGVAQPRTPPVQSSRGDRARRDLATSRPAHLRRRASAQAAVNRRCHQSIEPAPCACMVRWRETVPAYQHASRSDAPPEFYSRGREPTARSHKTPDWPDPSQEQGAARLTEPRNYQDFNDRVFVSCPYKW